MTTLKEIMNKRDSDFEFRNALAKAKNMDDIKNALQVAEMDVAPEVLQQIESWLRLKEQNMINTDLEKKINK